jgi:hypothetical protein
MTFAHLLNWCHHVAEHALSVRAGKWCDAAGCCFSDFPLLELACQTNVAAFLRGETRNAVRGASAP